MSSKRVCLAETKCRRVSYSGYYVTLPRSRYGFDSRYPLSQRKRDGLVSLLFLFGLSTGGERERGRENGSFTVIGEQFVIAFRTEGFLKRSEATSEILSLPDQKSKPSLHGAVLFFIKRFKPCDILKALIHNLWTNLFKENVCSW